MPEFQVDEVGYWTEIKLQIIKDYFDAYVKILNSQDRLQYAYIDGFAGAGEHLSRTTGEIIEGSPKIALNTEPQFHHYHFVDLDGNKAALLAELGIGKSNVSVYQGNCNEVLLNKVFPKCKYKDYKRALCLLDPYDLNPNWKVVYTAGQMKSIEIFLNFMIMDANRCALWKNPDKVSDVQKRRMNDFWGDSSWRDASYKKQPGLFGDIEEKAANKAIAEAYRKRLRDVAGFKFVPEPIPLRNSKGAIIYYLFFASPKESGAKIVHDIFNKYRDMGA